MSLLFNVEAEIQRQQRENYRDEEMRLVIIGNGINGDPYADDNHLWVRDIGSKGESGYSAAGLPYRVLAGVGPTPEIDKQVWIQWRSGPRKYQVVMSDPDFMQQTQRSMHLENPSDPHNQFITTDRLMPLLSKPYGGMKVNVQGWQYIVDGEYKAYRGTSNSGTAISQHVDLTAHVPATTGHHCYALIVFDTAIDISTTDPLDVFVSTSQAVTSALNASDIQECVAQMNDTSVAIKAYRLVNGMTEVVGHEDDRDLRGWVNVPGSGGGGIDQLTGDVTAGPGSGSQVATIANNAITQAKMADNSVGTAELIDANVTSAKLATDSVTTSKIEDYAVTLYKLASGWASYGGPGGNVIGYDMNGNAFETPNAVDIPATFGENTLDGDLIYFKVSDGKWWKIDADAGLVGTITGVVVSASGSTLVNQSAIARIYGRIDAYTGLTPGLPLYASNTPGAYSQTKPTLTAGGGTIVICEMGMALSATEAFINPRPVEFHKREILDDAETLSITHIADAQGRTRKTSAYVASSTIVLLETYATTNRDSAIQLRGQSGAGALVTVDSAGASLAALGNNGAAQFTLAQSIAVTAGLVTQATVFFDANTGSPTGTVAASLHVDDGTGKPSASALESVNFTPTASSNNTITFAGTTFISGTVWLKLTSNNTQASTVRWNVRYNNANPYASGVMKADSSASPGTWGTFGTTQDMRCTITTTALATNDAVGQGFSHASSTTVPYIDLYLKRTGTRSGDLTLEIQSNSAGLPSGTAISSGVSAVVLASSVSTSWGLVRFTFSSPSITGGTQYHIVLKTTDTADNSAYIEVGTDTSSPGYANGAVALLQSSSWAAASPAADACFAIYGVGTYYDQPVTTGLGSTVLDVWYGDSSFANQNTTTTFENVYGVTMDVVGVVTIEKA